ncbi:MAG: DUF3306 domain-containing protein [Thauera sp.]|uniref:DUF3306 domain-containing protein n=1 Tax=Thauera sp. TaxID=1905334 RepID=UPI001DF890DD|nr:DUF3306 domain-containing protein [Thauera sp.]MCB1944276.1 DUF3306 domain-containing protein [Thauera sp.]MCP5226269.1 DUF3306 domain-containing protein [Thauera sp.]HPE03500.1 DUF3306 domain-containing protein [Thauera sp.]
MSGGFLSRWSRRKLAAVAQAEAVVPVAGESPAPLRSEAADPLSVVPAAPDGAASAETLAGAAAEAGLPPVESLSLSSDFTAFLKDEVSEALRRKALHKLFSDPHFNQMDGLDIYIDDYSRPDPIPPEILAKLQHAREWLADDAAAGPAPDGATELVDAVPVDHEGGQAATAAEAASAQGRSAQAADASDGRCGDELAAGEAASESQREPGQNAP